MSAWSERVTSQFQREFARLWVVSDVDEILLTPNVAEILSGRGIEIVSYRDPLVFRLQYETEILGDDDDRRFLVHVRGDAHDVVPWDVLEQARVVSLSIPELFGSMEANAVRSIGSDRYEDLWEIIASRPEIPELGTSATRDFLATNIYRVVPALLRSPSDIWEQAFDLFFRGTPLPLLIATHVATRAHLPNGMSIAQAASILSDRASFIDRVQRDWDAFARAISLGNQPEQHLIPFSVPGIRTKLDSMVLDGTIAPASVDSVPEAVPAWMRIGMVRDEAAARDLVAQRVDLLQQDIPPADADHKAWLRFAERHAEIADDWRSIAGPADEPLEAMDTLAPAIDEAFFGFLGSHYDALSSNSFASAPSVVHQIAPHMAHRRNLGETRQALIVVDGLALDQWLILERVLRSSRGDLLIDSRSCFAWLPTLTGVSRQAIFAGDQPRAFAKTLGSTSAEPALWRRFWVNEGMAEKGVFYAKGLGHPDSCEELLRGPVADGVEVLGLVVDTVDEMLHGEIFGKQSLVSRIEQWLAFGEWARLVGSLIDAGYRLYITADHGNVDVLGMGRPAEGVLAEERGERSRIYDSDVLRQKAASAIDGARILQPGGLPESYRPLFAPHGQAFISSGKHAVVHGGTSIEEVIVPFVRISRKENS